MTGVSLESSADVSWSCGWPCTEQEAFLPAWASFGTLVGMPAAACVFSFTVILLAAGWLKEEEKIQTKVHGSESQLQDRKQASASQLCTEASALDSPTPPRGGNFFVWPAHSFSFTGATTTSPSPLSLYRKGS